MRNAHMYQHLLITSALLAVERKPNKVFMLVNGWHCIMDATPYSVIRSELLWCPITAPRLFGPHQALTVHHHYHAW